MTTKQYVDETAAAFLECPFTIVALDGMEFVQKNFAKYKEGDRAAVDFVKHERIPLSKRFNLIERGFVLQLKDDVTRLQRPHFEGVKCALQCEQPVYALSINTGGGRSKKRRPASDDLKGHAGGANTTATALKAAGGDVPPPLLQMQNLRLAK